MTFDELKARVAQLMAAAEQSAGQHNMVVGRLQEAKEMLAYMEAKGKEVLEAAAKGALEGAVEGAEKAVSTDLEKPADSSTPVATPNSEVAAA